MQKCNFYPITNTCNVRPHPRNGRQHDSSAEDVESHCASIELFLFNSLIPVEDLGLFLVSANRLSRIWHPHDSDMAPPEQNNFVFIDEDQRHKYSKSTLSAINAQVAKHAHKQRRSNAKSKSKSAPSSPPSLGAAENEKSSESIGTQDDQINKTGRRTSAPALDTTTRRPPDLHTSLVRQGGSSPKQRSKSVPQTKVEKEIQRAEDDSGQDSLTDETPPEDLADLFQNLCRITKYPAYQAFPFFLDLEERRLAHYCKYT